MRTKLFSATAALALLIGTYPVGVAHADDTTGPVFSNIHFSVPTVDSTQQAQTVNLMGHLQDNSGITQIVVSCYQQGAQTISVEEEIASSGLATITYQLPYQGEPGVAYTSQIADVTSFDFAIQLKLPQGRLPGTLSCDWLDAVDAQGNEASFDNYHNADGSDRTPSKLTITRGSGLFDNEAPTISAGSISASKINLANPQTLYFDVDAVDATGIYSLVVDCGNVKRGTWHTYMHHNIQSTSVVFGDKVKTSNSDGDQVTPGSILSTSDVNLFDLGNNNHWSIHHFPLLLNSSVETGHFICSAGATDLLGQVSASANQIGEFDVVNAPLGSPTAPASAKVSNIKPTTATFSWSGSDKSQKVTGYAVDISSNQYFDWVQVPLKNAKDTMVALNGLQRGVNYTLRVAAINSKGTGEFTYTDFSIPFTAPSAPRNVVASSTSTKAADDLYHGTAIGLSWDAPLEDGGLGGTDWETYNYSVELNGGGYTWAQVPHLQSYSYKFVDKQVVITGATGFSYVPGSSSSSPNSSATQNLVSKDQTISGELYLETDVDGVIKIVGSGLKPGTKYSIRIKAVGHGVSKPSSIAFVTIPPVMPSQPSGLTVKQTANSSASIVWVAPASGGSKIADYLIEYSSDAGATWQTANRPVSASTSFTIKQMAPKTTYLVRVSAKNAVGISAPSQTVSLTTR